MKTLRASLLLLLVGFPLVAQEAPSPSVQTNDVANAQRTPEELEQMVGAIALYPDALIALILPASTVPADIVLASRHVRENPGDRSQIEHRAWDESVKSLTNYPEVLNWMDENLQWTKQLGEAFAAQPADVMQAIQRLRAKARAAGTLIDTPQQQVIAEAQIIRIVPAQPDIIYVPQYEPDIVFIERPAYYPRPFLTFGFGVAAGSWLAFDCDWRRNTIWVGDRHRRWNGHDWHRPVVPIAPSNTYTRRPDVRQWRPTPHVSRPPFSVASNFRPQVVRPAPFGVVSSSRSYPYQSSGFDGRRRDGTPGTPPAAPSGTSRSFDVGPRPAAAYSRSRPSVVNPTVVAESTPAPLPPATPNLQPLPQARRQGGNPPREGDSRPRPSRNPTVTVAPSAPTTVVTAPPPPTGLPSVPAAAPTPARTYTRSGPPAGPRSPDRAPPAGGTRMIERSAPPAATRAPVVTAPPAAEPASATPAAAPAPAPRGDSRGNRGGDRRNDSNGR